jgi:nicotinate phosphoribosyltransferase
VTGLLTDLYELTMAASYWRRGINDQATFSLFVRQLPTERGFLVAAGIENCLDLVQDLRFDEEDLRYLRETLGFTARDIESFRRFRFTGDIWAIPEGRVALAGEPLVQVTAPLAEAQLIETILLNQVTFETTIASKAARCVIAAGGRDVVDFAFRRTQGIEAGLDVARVSALVGFAGTSTVEAARRYGLVDTLRGVERAIAVIKELGLKGRPGIRIDSGNLDRLTRQSRRMLDRSGLEHVRIFVSGGLDELQIDELVRAGAPIDAFGVGTRMGVSADHPYLDTAYKLVCYGERPVMKLSRGKVTSPGRTQVFRKSRPFGDLVVLYDEAAPAGREPLLEQVMAKGRRKGRRPSLSDSRARFEADLALLPDSARELRSPRAPSVRSSAAVLAMSAATKRALL